MGAHHDSVTAPLHIAELEQLQRALMVGGDMVLLEVERIEVGLHAAIKPLIRPTTGEFNSRPNFSLKVPETKTSN
eukprot:520962-Pyramimonas_sp.AAC.1